MRRCSRMFRALRALWTVAPEAAASAWLHFGRRSRERLTVDLLTLHARARNRSFTDKCSVKQTATSRRSAAKAVSLLCGSRLSRSEEVL
jgi:hypothetical protein